MVAGSRPLILGVDIGRLSDLVALELWDGHRTPHLVVIDEVAPWPEPRSPSGDSPETVRIYKGQSCGKSEAMAPLGIIGSELAAAVQTAMSAKAVELQRLQERQMMAALGLIPDRRTLLLDWPLTDPREEAARREREARAQERKANFRHPEGPCSYRATGSKRSRRRRAGRA